MADLDRWLDPPLLVLTSLAGGPKHGYAITQDVAENLGVQLSPGTLYGVIARLEERGYITALPADDRRRPYRITAAGAAELRAQTVRLRAVADLASKRTRLISRPAASS
jgi:DNA-binding PadR family transcriptional regulator